MNHGRVLLIAAALLCVTPPAGAQQAGAARAQESNAARHAGGLRRQAFLGVEMRAPSAARAGAEVRRISNPAVAEKIGLRLGDRILRVNGVLLDGPVTYRRIVPSLRAGDAASFEVLREGRLQEFRATLAPLPQERLEGVETTYDSVLTDLGHRLRVIVTRPRNAPGRLPAVFLVGWLSCDSVEYPFGPAGDGYGQLLHDIATRSGYVLVRTDKPGVGDSEGPPCVEADFHAELAGYRAAFRALARYDFVDPERVFILGLSNGGGVAPLVPEGGPVRGYIVAGGWSKTWLEHMLELERRRLRLSGRQPGEVNELMKGYAEFHTDYLSRKMTPREVTRAKPHLAALWYDGPEHQYGRPAAFFHQLGDLNLAAAWEKVEAPTLVMYGEYDWIMSRDDHLLIAELVNARSPGRATYLELPKTDHLLVSFESMQKAFQGDSGEYNKTATEEVLRFLRDRR
ncbi:MAG TPA: alpha/beta hydrolase [Pyrinomonadaceae bacterium]|nr:alpha/beta hydrolase [Pyrinomonadaceae bacterium]